MQNGIDDTGLLALTFTNKAAAEMKRRVEELTGGQCNAFLGTFHSWCARFLRRHIKPPFTSDFTIYDKKDSDKVWKAVGEDNRDAYRAALEKSNALDFDDLLDKTYETLATDRELRERYQRDIRYVLVDEFQDTNEVQYAIVKLLAQSHKNLMVVGDEDQCIYSWRGASIENINAFRRDFPGARIYKLEENFRSSKNIVILANRLVAENCNRLHKELFSNLPNGTIQLKQCYDEREEARNIALHIASAVRNHPPSLREVPLQGGDLFTGHGQEFALDMSKRLTPLHGGVPRSGGVVKAVKYSDFAVLMRLNATSRGLEEQFRAFNIPHIIWGGFKFYERAEIKSAINYLRVLVNPKDEVALIDILNYPKRGIGDSTIAKLRDNKFPSFMEGWLRGSADGVVLPAGISAKAQSGIKNFLKTLNDLREIHDNFGLLDLGGSLISTIGLDTLYKTGKEEDLSRLENLYQLEHAIKQFAMDNPTATLAQYLQSVSLVQDTDSGDTSDAVVISTVHSAKGLEFDNVFIIGLEDGLFPLYRAKQSTNDMEEERRLLYVAITRAKRNLYLSHCMSRYYQGNRNPARPSEFLAECGFDVPTVPRYTFDDF